MEPYRQEVVEEVIGLGRYGNHRAGYRHTSRPEEVEDDE